MVFEETAFIEQSQRVLDEQVVTLRGAVSTLLPGSDGLSLQMHPRTVTAIPYYTWANRNNYEMQVWLPTRRLMLLESILRL